MNQSDGGDLQHLHLTSAACWFGLRPSPPGQVGQGHIVEPRPLETRGGGFGSSACTLAGWRALSIYFPKQYYVAMAILFPLFDRQQSAVSSQHRLHA